MLCRYGCVMVIVNSLCSCKNQAKKKAAVAGIIEAQAKMLEPLNRNHQVRFQV